MVISARFASVCPLCRNTIAVGSRVNWERGSKATHVACPPPAAAPVTNIAPRDWTPRNLVADEVGSYVAVSDTDTIYHVVATRDGQRFYAEKFVVIGGERATESGTVINGDWQYEATRRDGSTERYSRLVARLLDSHKLRRMTADEVIDFATLYGRCVQHGGFLKSADSVDAGIGPVCAAKLGLDRKALAEAARKRRAASHGRDTATVSDTPSVPPLVAAPDHDAPRPASVPAEPADFEARYQALFGDDAPLTPPTSVLVGPSTSARPFVSARRRSPRTATASRSRWSRPSDDDLGHAAGYGSDDYAF